MEINVTWPQLKQIMQSKKIRLQFAEYDDKYFIFSIDSHIIYRTELYKNPQNLVGCNTEIEMQNLQDFEQNFKEKANRPLLLSPIEADSLFYSEVLEIPENQSSAYIEWDFGARVELKKVKPRPIQAKFGDKCYLEVWVKAGVLGPNPVKIREFGYVKLEGGDGWTGQWYEGVGTGLIPEYCILRLVYVKSIDLSYRRFYIDIEIVK